MGTSPRPEAWWRQPRSWDEKVESAGQKVRTACQRKEGMQTPAETLLRDADPETEAVQVFLVHMMIKLLWMPLLLIKEAQNIPGLRSERDSLDLYFPECGLSSINPLGDKSKYCGKKRLLHSNIFWQHKVKQRETDVFFAALLLDSFMGILALLFSKEYHCPQGFQIYFTLKSL